MGLVSEFVATERESQAVNASWPAGYEGLVRRHYPCLIQTLTLITFDRELAADAAQDAFLQLYLHWQEIRRHPDPVACVYRVGINRCKDHYRYLARSARLFRRLVLASAAEGEPLEWESRTDALDILGCLPRQQRTAAALFYKADFSVAEIAAVMNISEGAVKSHLSRARETLRRTLEEK
jgi:RNA polymerase sigma-70 factor (ECF subfamily)